MIAGIVVGSGAAILVIALYLHQVTYRLGVRHGRAEFALALRHARDDLDVSRRIARMHDSSRESWQDVATMWKRAADCAIEFAETRIASDRPIPVASSCRSWQAIRGRATMIGLRLASGDRGSADDLASEIAALCALGGRTGRPRA